MPPKAARGAGSGRGRGRGRGRGKADESDSTPSAPEVKYSDPDSQSTLEDIPMLDAQTIANTTPVHEQDDQNDPNSSPATQPTETPAPTPNRLPPPISNTNGTASSSGAKPAGAARLSKFKPKIARTNAKEREEREAREREKENARISAAAHAARSIRGALGRGRGGRGRGDAMGRGRMQTSGTASGPFAEAPTSSGVKKGFFSSGGGAKRESDVGFSRGAGGASGSTSKGSGGHGGSRATYDSPTGQYNFEPQYPDEDDETPRVDIEHINQSSDSEDDVVVTGVRSLNRGKGKSSNKGGLKPIRLDRKEHKERGAMVNTEPAVKSDPEEDDEADLMTIDESRSSKAPKRERRGTYDGDVKIKSEPGESGELGVDPQMIYSQEPTPSSPPGPDLKIPVEIGSDESNTEAGPAKPEPVSPRLERKAKPVISKKKVKIPVMQTEEDRAEWARHLEDVEILRKELGGMAASLQSQDKGKDIEGDVNMEGAAAQEPPKQELEDGRVYLFQFPPVLPKLYNEQTSSNPNFDEDVEMMVPLDLTKDEKEVKSEEVIEIKHEELDEEELRRRRERDKLVVEEGAIGKLVLRESGEVELVWGGTNMKVGRGIETSFYSLGAVVDGMMHWQKDERGRDIPANNGSRGKSMAMGEIMGKFVCSPDMTNIR